jgi:Tfp pilus assembly protein PilV
MAHKGIRQFQGDESGNIALGQLGFKILDLAHATNDEDTGDGHFVAFKVVGGADSADTADIEATVHQGDPLTNRKFLVGDIVWGAFKKITCTAKSDTSVAILCYYGNPI